MPNTPQSPFHHSEQESLTELLCHSRRNNRLEAIFGFTFILGAILFALSFPQNALGQVSKGGGSAPKKRGIASIQDTVSSNESEAATTESIESEVVAGLRGKFHAMQDENNKVIADYRAKQKDVTREQFRIASKSNLILKSRKTTLVELAKHLNTTDVLERYRTVSRDLSATVVNKAGTLLLADGVFGQRLERAATTDLQGNLNGTMPILQGGYREVYLVPNDEYRTGKILRQKSLVVLEKLTSRNVSELGFELDDDHRYYRAIPNDIDAKRILKAVRSSPNAAAVSKPKLDLEQPKGKITVVEPVVASATFTPLTVGESVYGGTDEKHWKWAQIPKSFNGWRYSKLHKHHGKTTFEIRKPGKVYLLTAPAKNWGGGGSKGAWVREVVSEDEFVRAGWERVQLDDQNPARFGTQRDGNRESFLQLWVREFKKPAKLSVRVHKYAPPMIVIPPQ